MKKYAIVYFCDDEYVYLDFCKAETPEQAVVWAIKQILCNGEKDQIKEFEEDEDINLDDASLPELKVVLDRCGTIRRVTDVVTEEDIYEY